MKNVLFAFIMVIGLAACAPATTEVEKEAVSSAMEGSIPAGQADATVLTGMWAGTYTCLQGLTGLTLNMTGDALGNVNAVFEFYPDPLNASVPEGSFEMTGVLKDTDELYLNAEEWIVQPDFYATIDLDGILMAENTVYAGAIPELEGCSIFELEKTDR